MGNMTIFTQSDAVAPSRRKELSTLGKTLASASTMRRIQTNTNGTFKRLVNGEKMGKSLRGEINIIIVNALPKVSRVFYAEVYDPDSEPSLPNCWSNQGDKPEASVPDPQHANCADCPMNIKGSGSGDKKACRYQRRLAVLVEGDESGDIYQFNVPSKSLFGKGSGNVHPFESYVKFLIANGVSPDDVVTNVSYDLEADSMALLFKPVRPITDEEFDMVQEAQAKEEARTYTVITVAQADHVSKLPKPAKTAKPVVDEDDDEDEEPAPRKTAKPAKTAKPVVDEDDDEDEEPAPRKTAKPAKTAKPVVDEDDEDDEDEEPAPKKRESKKPAKTAKPVVDDEDADEDEVPSKLKSIIDAWGDED